MYGDELWWMNDSGLLWINDELWCMVMNAGSDGDIGGAVGGDSVMIVVTLVMRLMVDKIMMMVTSLWYWWWF